LESPGTEDSKVGDLTGQKDMQVRRARSTVVLFDGAALGIYNFLTGQALKCDHRCLEFLLQFENWRSVESVFESFDYEPASVARELFQLIEARILVVLGTEDGDRDLEFERNWEWGAVAGLYHFGIRGWQFSSGDEVAAWIQGRMKEVPFPQLYRTHDQSSAVVALPPLLDSQFHDLSESRRSRRQFSNELIRLEQLSQCLAAGLGITAFIEDPVLGKLPLKPTPSGGALNPYEAFVYSIRVQGLESGVYHYSALQHSLCPVQARASPLRPSDYLGNQPWTDGAAAVIFLVAHFDRTMWKYTNPNAYRVVLIEAGHIAQNILLAAAEQQLAAAPTAAIYDRLVEDALALDSITQAAIYAIVVGNRSEGDLVVRDTNSGLP